MIINNFSEKKNSASFYEVDCAECEEDGFGTCTDKNALPIKCNCKEGRTGRTCRVYTLFEFYFCFTMFENETK